MLHETGRKHNLGTSLFRTTQSVEVLKSENDKDCVTSVTCWDQGFRKLKGVEINEKGKSLEKV